MASAKIRLKIGSIEIDYEGDSAFLGKDLLKLVQDLQKVTPAVAAAAAASAGAGESAGTAKPAAGQGLTTKSIATKLSAKTGSDLAVAAVAQLAIIKGQTSFKRAEINDSMKTAFGIYKASMTSNLTSHLQTLLKDDTLVETGTDTYALTPGAEAKLKGQLGLG